MKKISIFTITLLLMPTLAGCNALGTSDIDQEDDLKSETYEYSDNWGSVSALSSDEFTIEAMLTYAIEDEYSAYAEYDYILNNFDVTKPFSNIINAELSHIETLLPLFEVHGIDVPYDDSENHLLPVIDLEDTFRTGVTAEILNIDMYNLFLEQELPEDLRETFVALRDASIKHLAAFEKNLAKYEENWIDIRRQQGRKIPKSQFIGFFKLSFLYRHILQIG